MYMDRNNATTLLIYAQPGANSLAVEHEVLSTGFSARSGCDDHLRSEYLHLQIDQGGRRHYFRRHPLGRRRGVCVLAELVQGLGSAGGFKLMLEDRGGLGSQALVRAANALVDAANKDPDFAGVFTLFNAGSPSVYADIDRLKAEKVGLTPTDVFS